MYRTKAPLLVTVLILVAGCAAESPSISMDGDDIAGVVTSTSGPEAGVWVMAETDEFDGSS